MHIVVTWNGQFQRKQPAMARMHQSWFLRMANPRKNSTQCRTRASDKARKAMDWKPNRYKSAACETSSRKQPNIKPALRQRKKFSLINILMTAPATQLHVAKNETAYFHQHHHISKQHVPVIYLTTRKLAQTQCSKQSHPHSQPLHSSHARRQP